MQNLHEPLAQAKTQLGFLHYVSGRVALAGVLMGCRWWVHCGSAWRICFLRLHRSMTGYKKGAGEGRSRVVADLAHPAIVFLVLLLLVLLLLLLFLLLFLFALPLSTVFPPPRFLPQLSISAFLSHLTYRIREIDFENLESWQGRHEGLKG